MNLKAAHATPEVRPLQIGDSAAIDHIFRITADDGLRSSPDPRTLNYGSHIWCHPYPFLSAEYCFVVAIPRSELGSTHQTSQDDTGTDNPSGSQAVGYILSTPDTTTFTDRYAAEYLPTLPSEIKTPLSPDTDTTWRPDNLPNALLNKIQHAERWPAEIEADVPGVLERYPAHLHIDVLPEWQGQGWGTALMQTCLQKLKGVGVRGLHLQMVEGNTAARAFYKAVGFRQWGQSGKAEWCMVIDL